jgi:hypothetical protein
MYEQELYKKAQKRVKRKKGFYRHLKVYLMVNCFILFMGVIEGDPFQALPMPFLWGMGLLFHYVNVFGLPGSGILSEEWEDREIRKEMETLRKTYPNSVPKSDEIDMKEHLELKELRKNYDDSDLV